MSDRQEDTFSSIAYLASTETVCIESDGSLYTDTRRPYSDDDALRIARQILDRYDPDRRVVIEDSRIPFSDFRVKDNGTVVKTYCGGDDYPLNRSEIRDFIEATREVLSNQVRALEAAHESFDYQTFLEEMYEATIWRYEFGGGYVDRDKPHTIAQALVDMGYKHDYFPNSDIRFFFLKFSLPKEERGAFERDWKGIAVRKSPETSGGSVYLMCNGFRYKIGVSKDVDSRRRAIELASGMPTDVLHSVKLNNPYEVERYLHGRYQTKRAEGEWFDFDAEEVSAVIRDMNEAAGVPA